MSGNASSQGEHELLRRGHHARLLGPSQ